MAILTGFAPFIAFFVVMRLATPEIGLAAAFLVALLTMLRERRRGASIKLLQLGSLILFGVLALYGFAAAPHWTVATVRLAVDGGLLVIVLVTLLIGQPFTLQYAREQVPAQYWTTPLFLAANRRITAAWALAFAVMASADAAAAYCPAVPLAFDVAATVAALLGALWFTRWYPARLRRAL
jgi:hypothetical protein